MTANPFDEEPCDDDGLSDALGGRTIHIRGLNVEVDDAQALIDDINDGDTE